MKKLTFTLLLTTLFAGAFAQYKKASFFEKEGRTYGLGASLKALGDGKGSPIGFYAAFGRDQDGKRLFTWWELQFIPGYGFTKDVIADLDGSTKRVTGKAKPHLIYGYNWGWHFIKSEGEQPKLQPYLTAGFNICLLGGVKEIDDEYYNWSDYNPAISDGAFSFGIGGGAGLIYNLNSWFALQGAAGYTYQINFTDAGDSGKDDYYMYTKHPYVSVGVRFRVSKG